jgi:asparagine synthetase B (glutamine-hydrolysing)
MSWSLVWKYVSQLLWDGDVADDLFTGYELPVHLTNDNWAENGEDDCNEIDRS